MRIKTINKQLVKEQYERSSNKTQFVKNLRVALNEATFTAPVSDSQIREFRHLLSEKIPASLSIFLIHDVLHDDELFSELESFSQKSPDEDARDIIAHWASNNMPHLLISHEEPKDWMSVVGSQFI